MMIAAAKWMMNTNQCGMPKLPNDNSIHFYVVILINIKLCVTLNTILRLRVLSNKVGYALASE